MSRKSRRRRTTGKGLGRGSPKIRDQVGPETIRGRERTVSTEFPFLERKQRGQGRKKEGGGVRGGGRGRVSEKVGRSSTCKFSKNTRVNNRRLIFLLILHQTWDLLEWYPLFYGLLFTVTKTLPPTSPSLSYETIVPSPSSPSLTSRSLS